MKTLIQLFLFPYIFLFGVSASAENNHLGTFKLKGTIADQTINTVRLRYNSSQSGYFERNEREIDCRVQDGKFEFNLNKVAQFGYVQLVFPRPDGSMFLEHHPHTGMVSSIFLAEAGDQITINIGSTELSFSGKGADKYNCEVKVELAAEQIRKNWPKKGKDEDVFTDLKNQYIKITENSLALLKGYKTVLDPLSYSILELNYKTAGILSFIGMIGVNTEIKRFKENLDYFSLTALSPLIAEKSKNYADLLYHKERFLLKSENEAYANGKRIPLEKYIDIINSKYTGPLKDKLLTLVLLWGAGDGYDLALKKAKPLIKSKYYLGLLEGSNNIIGAGSPFYNFSLQNAEGKLVSLKDLKGKVMVVDFFFTGCTGCVKLTKAMTAVIDEFKGNPDVVFVSIDVDKTKDMFIAATKNRKYTHEEAINLWTNGKGEEHELIKYYGFQGYPELFLLDKDGKILYGKPPRPGLNRTTGEPTKEGSTGDFIKIIKDYLAASPSAAPAPIKMPKN